MAAGNTSAQALQKGVEVACDVGEQLKLRQSAVQKKLEVLGRQEGADLGKARRSDEATLQLHTAELAAHPRDGLAEVRTFLSEELKQDAPTGKTPQCKDCVYPRTLERSRRREELIECFSKRQQELQATLSFCESVQEEQVDEGSLEEVSICNDTTIHEQSVDEKILCK